MDFPRRLHDEALVVDSRASVSLRAPARLHLGFLDPGASLGRRFGSLGLVIDGFETEVEISAALRASVSARAGIDAAEVARAQDWMQRLQRESGCREPLHLRLLQVLPDHAGFGSGTQLALAIARAFAHWHGLDIATARLAQWLGRGARSGIGIAGFDQGGLLVDGGPGAGGEPAPLLSRVPLPADWRVLVVQDRAQKGLSGAEERRRIESLAPLPRAQAADICHQVLMRVLPGAATADFTAFASGITHVQHVLGDYFAPAQGGHPFASAAVERVIDAIAAAEPDAGLGQSSWGPTGFAILPSAARAQALADALQASQVVGPSLALRVVSGRNTGALLLDRRAAGPAP
ncbi:beta-ribofuranosylaminobenzene 5'-phosphate synthase family protein [Variovorax sp.]|uniref:beta-ribofuranosylaminobenzene 5'-phosphate synthase family protein n=1 Tax=Variovorax sp. TaxID=1871043 RepID=UPI002D5A4393|nr:beta-ribofuranosylaminobenzene 5'-phosphate synthase family protein [Variovorax sp.]HYP85332.1 beta-ribofuranosylaminobenzene 5'-phosphate synthase family protein [Variovorax sp.]